MHILEITSQEPDRHSGGGLGVLQTALSLTGISDASVDYIGPEITDQKIKALYRNCYELAPDYQILHRMINLAHGITNARYNSWKHLNINFDAYDYIVMDFTKLDYVLKKINPERLFVRVHNIEVDYAQRDYATNKSQEKRIIAKLAHKQEQRIVNSAHRLVALTEHDKKRLIQLYAVDANKIDIIPVCLEQPSNFEHKHRDRNIINILITGSLWFGENANGVKWFIAKVLPFLDFDYHLTIAGAHPSDEIKELVKHDQSITLVDTPDNMIPYFDGADIVACPIFNGAGMKVKVAEALSYSLPVVGTEHAFVGYNIHNGIDSYEANSENDFADALNRYAGMSPQERQQVCDNALHLFRNDYSIDTSIRRWSETLTK